MSLIVSPRSVSLLLTLSASLATSGSIAFELTELSRTLPSYLQPAEGGFAVQDVDGDGRDELVYLASAHTQTALIVAGRLDDGKIGIKHTSSIPYYRSVLAVPEAGATAAIHVLREDGILEVFDGWPLSRVATADLNLAPSRARLADVDRDGRAELFIGTSGGIGAYLPMTGERIWEAAVPGGVHSLTIAQSDPSGSPTVLVSTGSAGPSRLFDAVTGASRGVYEAGFGASLATGALGPGGAPAIAGLRGAFGALTVHAPVTPWPLHWTYDAKSDFGSLHLAQWNGRDHLLTGDMGPSAALRVIDPAGPLETFAVATDDSDIHAIATADLDGDGDREFVFAVKETPAFPSVASRVHVVDATGTPRARIESSRGRFATVAIGDVDGDGRLEQVVAAHTGTTEARGSVHILDASSGELLWQSPHAPGQPAWQASTTALAIGTLRTDAGPSIVMGGRAAMAGWLRVLDGRTRQTRFEVFGQPGNGLETPRVVGIVLADVDGDGHGDIAVASGGLYQSEPAEARIAVYSGVDGRYLGQTDALESDLSHPHSLLAIPADDDGVEAFVLATAQALHVFDPHTLAHRSSIPMQSSGASLASDGSGGTSSIAVFKEDGAVSWLDPQTWLPLRTAQVPAPLHALAPLDSAGRHLLIAADGKLRVVDGGTGTVLADAGDLGGPYAYHNQLAVSRIGKAAWSILSGSDLGYFRHRLDDGLFADGFEALPPAR